MASLNSDIVKSAYLIVDHLFNILKKENTKNKKYYVRIFGEIFDTASKLIALEKTKVDLETDEIAQEIINKFRIGILIPYLSEYDSELLPLIRDEANFNYLDDQTEIDHDHEKQIKLISKEAKELLTALSNIKSK